MDQRCCPPHSPSNSFLSMHRTELEGFEEEILDCLFALSNDDSSTFMAKSLGSPVRAFDMKSISRTNGYVDGKITGGIMEGQWIRWCKIHYSSSK